MDTAALVIAFICLVLSLGQAVVSGGYEAAVAINITHCLTKRKLVTIFAIFSIFAACLGGAIVAPRAIEAFFPQMQKLEEKGILKLALLSTAIGASFYSCIVPTCLAKLRLKNEVVESITPLSAASYCLIGSLLGVKLAVSEYENSQQWLSIFIYISLSIWAVPFGAIVLSLVTFLITSYSTFRNVTKSNRNVQSRRSVVFISLCCCFILSTMSFLVLISCNHLATTCWIRSKIFSKFPNQLVPDYELLVKISTSAIFGVIFVVLIQFVVAPMLEPKITKVRHCTVKIIDYNKRRKFPLTHPLQERPPLTLKSAMKKSLPVLKIDDEGNEIDPVEAEFHALAAERQNSIAKKQCRFLLVNNQSVDSFADGDDNDECKFQKEKDNGYKRLILLLIILTCFAAFCQGCNVASALATPVLLAFKTGSSSGALLSDIALELGILALTAVCLSIGTASLGWKYVAIKRRQRRNSVTRINDNSITRFSAEFGSTVAILLATLFGIPASFLHCKQSSNLTVGSLAAFLSDHTMPNNNGIITAKKLIIATFLNTWPIPLAMSLVMGFISMVVFENIYYEMSNMTFNNNSTVRKSFPIG